MKGTREIVAIPASSIPSLWVILSEAKDLLLFLRHEKQILRLRFDHPNRRNTGVCRGPRLALRLRMTRLGDADINRGIASLP